MKYQIILEEIVVRQIFYFKKNNPIISDKIKFLLEELLQNPLEGSGLPKLLKYELEGYYSRRIARGHRLVYKVSGNEVRVVSCKYQI